MTDPMKVDALHAEILALADAGYKAADIAEAVGCTTAVVYRVAKGRLSRRHGRPARPPAQLRRMIAAHDGAASDGRDAIAHRFGLKNRFCLRAVVWKARRTLARQQSPSA